VVDSLLTQTTSSYFFESLSSSRLLRLDIRQLQTLISGYEGIRTMVLKATAFALKGVLERQVELQTLSAEERYRLLLRRSPHVLQLIPHKYLANYLGMDPATFSKLLSSVRID
jgi:CRP-like cAMP-binding protein